MILDFGGFKDYVTEAGWLISNFQAEPSVANAAKQGAVSGLAKASDRFSEQTRSAPEYTAIEGGREVQVMVQESPTEI